MPDNSEFEKSLQHAASLIINQTRINMERACLVIESEAKKNCPKNQGILAASITSETLMSSAEILGLIGTNMQYGPYVHNGTGIYAKNGDGRKEPWTYHVASGPGKGFYTTKGQKPQPFLEDAKLHNKNRIAKILGGK